MPFTVNDFQDLIHLLDAHPEWRADLRQRVLSDELLQLPSELRQFAERTEQRFERVESAIERLAEAQARTEQRVEELAQAQARTEQRVEELAQAEARTESRLEELAQAQTQITLALRVLVGRVDTLDGKLDTAVSKLDTAVSKLDDLRGSVVELRYQRHAHAYFSSIARGLHHVDQSALADMLDDAKISGDDRTAVLLADLVMTGKRREDSREIHLVVEVSAVVDAHDVERAHKRAAILQRAIQVLRGEELPVLAIVGGESIDARATALAQQLGVIQVKDGRMEGPLAS